MSSLVEQARQFGVVLQEARKRASAKFEWYPYDSLANVQHLEALLGAAPGATHAYVMESARKEGILDVGCGDGDIAFFFESLGYNVTCIDYPPSNQNDMQGLRALHRELHSGVTVREVDVDSEFPLDGKYGLTFCLGLLYHLKNPYFVLERLARTSRFCVLSTRIARCLPGGAPLPPGHALAYLLDEDELNLDDTNYWIFSEPALRRLLKRTRWEVVQFFASGDTVTSDPSSLDHDERAFCLLRSHYGNQHLDLLEGWHDIEGSGWRWTQRQFAARATSPSGLRHTRVAMHLFAPPFLIEKFGSITLSARIDDTEVQPLVMRDPGTHVFVRKIPQPSEVTSVVFQLDKFVGPDAEYSRELGIIVASLEFT
jgi:tRNA (mo5U34)-methyltransferase